MAGLQLQLDTEREEKRLLQEQLQQAEVGPCGGTSLFKKLTETVFQMRRESKRFFFLKVYRVRL